MHHYYSAQKKPVLISIQIYLFWTLSIFWVPQKTFHQCRNTRCLPPHVIIDWVVSSDLPSNVEPPYFPEFLQHTKLSFDAYKILYGLWSHWCKLYKLTVSFRRKLSTTKHLLFLSNDFFQDRLQTCIACWIGRLMHTTCPLVGPDRAGFAMPHTYLNRHYCRLRLSSDRQGVAQACYSLLDTVDAACLRLPLLVATPSTSRSNGNAYCHRCRGLRGAPWAHSTRARGAVAPTRLTQFYHHFNKTK